MASTIRRAGADDVEAFLDVFEAVAAEGRWLGAEAPIDREAVTAQFADWIADERRLVLVAQPADDGGPVIGWIRADHRTDGKVGLGMAILDGHRSSGTGSQLLAAVIDWARRRDAHKVVLEVWPHNTAAQGLYEKFGFVVEGHYRRHWRRRDGSLWDSLSMGLVLDERSPGGPTS